MKLGIAAIIISAIIAITGAVPRGGNAKNTTRPQPQRIILLATGGAAGSVIYSTR